MAKDTKIIMTSAAVVHEIYKAQTLRSSVASQLLNQGVSEVDFKLASCRLSKLILDLIVLLPNTPDM
jgi:hypothetical protein